MRIVCFGDSITQGHDLGDDKRWTGLLAKALPGHEIVNRGSGGNTTAMALDRIVGEILPLLPAIVVVEFGLNDCALYPGRRRNRVSLAEFRENYSEILDLCAAAGGRCLLIANHKVSQPCERQGNGRTRQENAEPYNQAIRDLARERSLPLLDIAARTVDHAALLHEDGVHLNETGNRVYAGLARTALTPLLLDRPPLFLVAAMGRNRVIGNQGQLPWHEPADLAHFKRTTTGHAVIMGRKTWESLGKPLPKRRNLVITRQPGFQAPGAEVFTDLVTAIAAARTTDAEPCIIGGGEIYAQALPLATRIELTEIDAEPHGDASFPALPPHWLIAAERSDGKCTFRTWVPAS